MRALRLARVVLSGGPLLFAACGEDAGSPTAPAPASPTLAEVTAWIEANSHPFDGSHLSLPHAGIEFFREIVGEARIVSLGENTHGTRDFFEMKARLLRFLVEEMGFDTFAIEATWPESRRLDRYVRTGEGDPRRLLSGLYFWTWNTESVLEMIEWMRGHNEAGGSVGFHGFDMQSPGMALHDVREYVGAVDPDRLASVTARLDCLEVFANDHRGRFPASRYGDQTGAYREGCGESLEEARTLLLERRAEYEAAAGEDAFEVALQGLRVAYQYHLMAIGEQSRDESMAENTEWIARRIGPEGRMVLWAHNFHVSANPVAQGFHLRQAFGDDMVIVGFSHEGGRFTAAYRAGDQNVGLTDIDLDPVRSGSFEHYLSLASAPRFVLDLRNRNPGSDAASWLAGSRPFRTIGSIYHPAEPGRYWLDTPLGEWFDVLIHHEHTRPTKLLTFLYPDSF